MRRILELTGEDPVGKAVVIKADPVMAEAVGNAIKNI